MKNYPAILQSGKQCNHKMTYDPISSYNIRQKLRRSRLDLGRATERFYRPSQTLAKTPKTTDTF